MADVRTRWRAARRDGDRGQLILVTGLAVAVTLVAVVLLLNTVIYTQNLASRGTEVGDSEAVGFRSEVAVGVGGLIDAENRVGYETRTKVEDNVTAGVERFDALLSRRYGEKGTIAVVETDSLTTTDGVILRQTNASRGLNSSDASGEQSDWTLATDAQQVRRFRLTVSRENLTDTVDETQGFTVRLDGDSGDTWRAYVYDDGGITVAVKNGTDAAEVACTASGPKATIDLTAGTLNGTTCPKLQYATGVASPHDVAFRNGERATGTYELTLTPDGAQTGNFASADAGDSPWAAPAVYAATFEIHFETPTVTYHATVRVAQGEPA
ncbi:DUF7261 family protein [Halorussus halophilus]|uniref:DUF7261 family protein n=1 Tax=Halorussus halophilus TaxID=2650975 RepID=UPI001300FC3B|nr:hypothetical protein [Halorussus halophilus]